MSIPVLYLGSETKFKTNGICRLPDATKLEIKEKLNGEYELEMNYPITGKYFSELKNNRIIYTVVNRNGDKQPFDIYEMSEPINGIVTVYAQHLSYRLKFMSVMPFKATGTPEEIWQELKKYCVSSMPFNLVSDIKSIYTIETTKPITVKEILQGTEGSFLDTFGGEFTWDKWTVKLSKRRGTDTGYKINYGGNLTNLTHDENLQEVYTGIFPYVLKQRTDSKPEIIMLPEKYIMSKYQSSYPYLRIKPIDLSSKFSNDVVPTTDMLRKTAHDYLINNQIGKPKTSIDVSFINYADTLEYFNKSKSDVSLGDIVKVLYYALGVNALAKLTETVWDGLLNRYHSIHLGDAKNSLVSQIQSDYYEQEMNFNKADQEQAKKFDTYIGELQEAMKLEGSERQKAIEELQKRIEQESTKFGKSLDDLKSETDKSLDETQKIFTEELSHKVGQDIFDQAKENTQRMIGEINQNLQETRKKLQENFVKQVETINKDIKDIRTVMASDTSGAIQLIKDKNNPNKINQLIANNTDGSSLKLSGNGLEFRDKNGDTTSAITRDGHVAADRISGTIINAISTNSAYISGGTISGTYITGNTISGGYIQGSNITGGNISGSNLSGGMITGSTIVAGKVYGALQVFDSSGGSMNISIGGNNGSWALYPTRGGDVIHVGSLNYESMMSSGQFAVKSGGGETHVYGTSIDINGNTVLHSGNWRSYINVPTYSEIKSWVQAWVADYVTETATKGHRLIIWKG